MDRLGLDFDNTIVCYDEVFHRVALEQGLIPADLPVGKSAVRDHLRATGREDAWTAMQGLVYGPRMIDARPFPGVLDFIAGQLRAGTELFIVSHKTRHPYLGPKYDLHDSARGWLDAQGFFDPARIGLPRERVFFELTKQAKMQRIADLGCMHFIDDLPELLGDPGFPQTVRAWLFDPHDDHAEAATFPRLKSWQKVPRELRCA